VVHFLSWDRTDFLVEAKTKRTYGELGFDAGLLLGNGLAGFLQLAQLPLQLRAVFLGSLDLIPQLASQLICSLDVLVGLCFVGGMIILQSGSVQFKLDDAFTNELIFFNSVVSL
jgi:hypothetical protein